MEHIRPLVIKYIYTAAITAILLTYILVPSVALGTSLVIALFVTLALYFVGDLIILPRYGNVPAVVANFVMAAVILALANAFTVETISFAAAIVTAVGIGIAEWFFHRYVLESEAIGAGAGEKVHLFGSPEEGDMGSPEEHQPHEEGHHEEGHHEGAEGGHEEHPH